MGVVFFPHPNQQPAPSNAELLNLLGSWVARAADLPQILVHNPAQVYGFEA